MLYLISGLPGAGKTLFAIDYVEKLRLQSTPPRQVFYHGIKDLTLPWVHFDDPKAWHSLSSGSIIVLDEAWEWMPKRGPGSRPPEHIEQLAVHRHKGFDVFLIVQHAQNQLDFFVRGLVNYHYHVKRIFGSAKSRLLYWEGLGDPSDYHSRKESQGSFFSYPAERFTQYKSAEVHTVQRSIPWKKVSMIVGGLVAVPLCFYAAYQVMKPDPPAVAALAAPGPLSRPVSSQLSRPANTGMADARSFQPVIPEIPYTTPAFQDGVKVVSAPVIAGCGHLRIRSRSVCKCTDQQGNVLKLQHRTCLAYLETGAFNPMRGSKFPTIAPYVPSLAAPSGTGGAGSGAAGPQASVSSGTSSESSGDSES